MLMKCSVFFFCGIALLGVALLPSLLTVLAVLPRRRRLLDAGLWAAAGACQFVATINEMKHERLELQV